MKKTTVLFLFFILVFLVSCQKNSPFEYALPDYNPSFKTEVTVNASSINAFVDTYLSELEQLFPFCEEYPLTFENDEINREEFDQFESGMCKYRPWQENVFRYEFQYLMDLLQMENDDYMTNQPVDIDFREQFIIESNDTNLRITYTSSNSEFTQFTFGDIDGVIMMEYLYAYENTSNNTLDKFTHYIYYENQYFLYDAYGGESRTYYYEDFQANQMTYYKIRIPGDVLTYYNLQFAYQEDNHIEEVLFSNSGNDDSENREVNLLSTTTIILNDDLDVKYEYYYYAPLRSTTFYANVLEVESLEKLSRNPENDSFFDAVLDNGDIISDITVYLTPFDRYPKVLTHGPLSIMDRDLVPGYLSVSLDMTTTIRQNQYEFDKQYPELFQKYGISGDSEDFDDFTKKSEYIINYVVSFEEDHF